MKAGVITFPGSNCDEDLQYALRLHGFTVESLWHKDVPSLSSFDLVALPGGFSFGDYLRSGAIAAQSPIMRVVIDFANHDGFVLGICNGFQTLCESKLLPGALARNESLKFICDDVAIEIQSTNSPWTNTEKPGERLKLPIAHGDGRYVVDDATYEILKKNDQILLTYVNNPNGSVHSIAGVCNEKKNVFGLMPHPERATDLRSRDGEKIWNSLNRFLKERR